MQANLVCITKVIHIVDPVAQFTRVIIIKNNTISNTSDRTIRFGVGNDETVIVENNNFTNCTENGSLLKTQQSKFNKFSLINNVYKGNSIQNYKNLDLNFIVEIVIE